MAQLSVILPAHNEAAVIQRTLRSILASRFDGPLQVIVVANGCSDGTAELARGFGPPVEVIDTPVGNKVHALNLGDRQARYFPRAFMDADVELSPTALQSVVDAFAEPGVRLVAPDCRHLYRGWNPLLAGYYQLWRSLPYVRNATMGRGFYAIDQELRRRFDEFPPLTGDDKFIRNLAEPSERRIARGGFSTVYMPATLRELLAVKTRWTYGNLELGQQRSDLNSNDTEQHTGGLRHVLARPWLWPHLPLFVFVYWYSHRAAGRLLRQRQGGWGRANSSRRAEQRDG